ncbi:hypothetical protein GP486_001158 [Trichoglossum hirsutum]|uniref:Uncharacterized protein n=1 Tax=Trichoglossum hirsutum TaxID=265104 RepID=A0A9P8RSY6_9PEZI|nr:hypothetical protein GP486_001158 [Trichoglossum hirsutum]
MAAPSMGSALWRSLRAYQVYGANTDVGKTVMSTILCKAMMRRFPDEKTWYIKPVSTGPQAEADDRHVARFSESSTHCLFQFDQPIPPDSSILQKILSQLSSYALTGRGTAFLETAGGVHSPTPSGTSQADFYRPLRLPVVLVADHRLGGISSSISAFESLHVRGYDIDFVLLFRDSRYQNDDYLSKYFQEHGISTLSLPSPPARRFHGQEDEEAMVEYYDRVTKLDEVGEMISMSEARHEARVKSLESMSSRAYKHIWYPFTQHRDISPSSIMTVDSAHGDFFQTYRPDGLNPTAPPSKSSNLTRPTFDGSASWWTQGLGHANPKLSLSAAYAAGRYGHVMFPGGIHEPALSLAELLLHTLNNPRLQRVFYSDNGSSGMEIAIKMGLRAAASRYGWDDERNGKEVEILGLKGSYHGDTLGAMDCSEPSAFNQKVQWYRGRGFWFDYPRVKMVKGIWVVQPPEGMEGELGSEATFASLREVFDIESRKKGNNDAYYRKYITNTLVKLIKDEGRRFGALVIEPVVLGAGGMMLVDPLFQHTLVQVIRSAHCLFSPSPLPSLPPHTWTGLPIVADEVFTGLYRLGRPTSSSFLAIHPDISVHAKLLTGGLVPLCATVASESVFESFLGKEKSDALLHGHSYTAHAVGCKVAETAVKMMVGMEKKGAWEGFKKDWLDVPPHTSSTGPGIWSHWSRAFVNDLSYAENVEGVIAIGSILAISLHDRTGAGYTSTAANTLRETLFNRSGADWNVHSRVLGNVLYLMASQTSKMETLRSIEGAVRGALL